MNGYMLLTKWMGEEDTHAGQRKRFLRVRSAKQSKIAYVARDYRVEASVFGGGMRQKNKVV